MFELPILLICSHSLPVSAYSFLHSLCLKKCAIFLAVMTVHGFLYNQPHLLRGLKRRRMARSTAQTQIVPRFKEMGLKLMAQRATLSVDEY